MPALSTLLHWQGAIRDYDEFGAPDPPPVETGTYFFESSSVEGGGFQNCLAVSPFLNGSVRPYLLGSDVSGPFRSINRGAQWLPVNNGSINNSGTLCAVMWHDTTPGKAYLFEDAKLHRSTDWGVNWTGLAAAVNGDGNGLLKPPEHPRQTGNLLAQDNSTATKYLWCGTNTLGVRQSIDDGATWRSTVMAGHRITGIALDPLDRDSLYVTVARSGPNAGGGGGSAENGVWRIPNARAATMGTPVKLTAYPGTLVNGPHDLIAVNDGGTTRIYITGDEDGMFKFTPSTSTWATINTGLNVNGSAVYQAVCADPNNPQILYCGHWRPASRNAMYRSANGGTTWTSVTGPSPVTAPATGNFVIDWQMFGTAIRSWMADIPYHSFAGPSSDWLASHIAIDPDVPGRVLAVGRGGCWWGTLSGTTRTWQPANHGLLVTVCMAVVQDDLVAGRAAVGNMDYTMLFSTDNSLQIAFQAKPATAHSTGDAVAFDMAATVGPSRLFLGASERGSPTGKGAVWSSANPDLAGAATWTNESGAAFDSDVMALSVGRNSGGTRVILASVSNAPPIVSTAVPPLPTIFFTNGGLWRKVGTAWTQFTDGASVPFGLSGATAGAPNMGCIRFRRDSPVVYALDNDALWRSNDAGGAWTKILTGVAGTYGTYNGLELDPVDLAIVYVSSGNTLRRVNNASTSTGTGNTTTTILWAGTPTTASGNIAVRVDGTEMFLNVRNGNLMRSATGLFRTAGTQAGCGWVDVATAFLRNNSGNIRSLAVTPDGTIMTADNGSGALRGFQV